MSAIPQYNIRLSEIAILDDQFRSAQLELIPTKPRYLLKSGNYYTEWEIRDSKGNKIVMWATEPATQEDDRAVFTVGGKDAKGGFSLLKQAQAVLASLSVKIDNPKSQL